MDGTRMATIGQAYKADGRTDGEKSRCNLREFFELPDYLEYRSRRVDLDRSAGPH